MTTKEPVKSVNYFKQFDGARGLLAFSIFILHLHFTYIKVPSTLANFTLHSFFVASAFLITKILLKDKQKTNSFSYFFKQFYIKRILRIFPVYFGYIFGFIFFALVFKFFTHHDFYGVLTEVKRYGLLLITFTYNFRGLVSIFVVDDTMNTSNMFPHLWSISMEEQFYIVIPFLVFFLSEKSLKRLCYFMIFIFPLIRIAGYFYLRTQTDNYFLLGFTMIRNSFFQFDAFFYGILIALYPKLELKKIRYLFYGTILAIIVQEIINLYFIQQQFGLPFHEMISRYDIYARCGAALYIDILLNVSCFAFLYLVFHTTDEFPLLLNKNLVEYGKFSFGSYVYQYIFIFLTYFIFYEFLKVRIPLFFTELICTVICLTLIIQFSKFSYYKFELYFINMKDKLIAKLKKD